MTTDQRLIVITGGSSGLGRALAAEYLARGDRVVIAARREDALHTASRELNSDRLHVYPIDVTDESAVNTFAAWVTSRFGRCDVLVNNAGAALFRPFAEMGTDDIRRIWEVNAAAVLLVTRAFLPMMLEAGSGRIVNIASLAGRVATAKAAVYAAAKAAVIRFSEGLRHELAGTGISVTCVLPGPIDTPFLDRADATGAYRERVRRHLLTPERCARLIVRAAEAGRAELAIPFHLHALSLVYGLLPERLHKWLSPFLNRK